MSEKSFKLEIITPGRQVFKGDTIRLQAPSKEGYFEVLYNHTSFLAALDIGRVKVTTANGIKFFSISGGFAEVYNNNVSILAETAEQAGDIDVTRAQSSKERAEQRLRERGEEIDIDRAKITLLRALNRMSIAEMTKQ